jgi:hypothetical protein
MLVPAGRYKKRLTGEDLETHSRWDVAGTDLGIPYELENGSIGYLFGDTFGTQFPEAGVEWRSPVILRSNIHPGDPDGVRFDTAAGITGDGVAPEVTYNGHRTHDGAGTSEWTVIPNDAISFPPNGPHIMSYMSVRNWDAVPNEGGWRTNYAGLAVSSDGNHFERLPVVWWNDEHNKSPFQMWTMQRDGDWVYVFSVRAGRQRGPMMLQRVPADRVTDQSAYQGWGFDGNNWGWGRPATSILPEASYGEPSVRKLRDGTWAMVYFNAGIGAIVSRTASGPDQPWSPEKVQVTAAQEPNLYGGFVHPWSTSAANELHMMVSRWSQVDEGGQKRTTHYHTSQYVGSL